MPKVTSPLSVLDVEMVQWSAYLPSILTTRVWFSPTSKLLFLLFFNKNSYRNPKFNLLEFTCTVLKIKMSFFLPLFGLFRLFHTQQANTNSYKIVNQKVCSCALLPTVAQPQTYSSLFFIWLHWISLKMSISVVDICGHNQADIFFTKKRFINLETNYILRNKPHTVWPDWAIF